MTHTRLRKFNTRDTYPGSRMDNDLCQVVRAGNIVFLRGLVESANSRSMSSTPPSRSASATLRPRPSRP